MRENDGLKRAAGRKGEEGVALIIVLGFLGLMLMMAVAFMTQARVERLVSDSSTEAMRARQIAQTGVAAGIQDYVNAIQKLRSQSEDDHDIFLSGDLNTGQYSYKKETYGTTNLWRGKVKDWVWDWHREGTGDDSVKNMEWIWVGEEPGKMSRILGRYAYACFDMSGAVDANLLGREFGEDLDPEQYGAQTNRNNVRKMILGAVRADPEMNTESQARLAQYQGMWQGFDTPLALKKLTDGKVNDGDDDPGNRWSAIGNDESGVGKLATDYLSCYSYATVHKGSGSGARMKLTTDNIKGSSLFGKIVRASGASESDVEKALKDYTSAGNVPEGTDYPSVKAVPMFNEVNAKIELLHEGNIPKLKLTLKVEFWFPFESQENAMGTYKLKAPSVVMSGTTPSGDIAIRYRAVLEGGGVVGDTLTGAPEKSEVAVTANWNEGKPMSVPDEDALVYEFAFPATVTQKVAQVMLDSIRITSGMKLENGDGKAVDAMPDKLSMGWAATRPTLTPQANTMTADMEVIDPRLNHIAGMWVSADESSLGEKNAATKRGQEQAKAKLGYDPAPSFYCRNGSMKTPAELGYLPVWNGQTPWMTLDIFTDEGIDLMNQLVCPAEANWDLLNERGVYYTNGTINPYTRDQAVLNGAFYGLDLRVPGCKGTPDDNEVLGVGRTKELTDQLIKTTTPENNTFKKDGAAGWGRVLRYKGFSLNKNQRVALLHNTWGLFNESDKLFVIVVVAQSISEAPEKVDKVGHWNPDEDMITGERWAVALCWTDASADVGQSTTKETDIIMFQYLNE